MWTGISCNTDMISSIIKATSNCVTCKHGHLSDRLRGKKRTTYSCQADITWTSYLDAGNTWDYQLHKKHQSVNSQQRNCHNHDKCLTTWATGLTERQMPHRVEQSWKELTTNPWNIDSKNRCHAHEWAKYIHCSKQQQSQSILFHYPLRWQSRGRGGYSFSSVFMCLSQYFINRRS